MVDFGESSSIGNLLPPTYTPILFFPRIVLPFPYVWSLLSQTGTLGFSVAAVCVEVVTSA